MQAALDLFEATWDELIGMPSRKSAADEPEVGLLRKMGSDTRHKTVHAVLFVV